MKKSLKIKDASFQLYVEGVRNDADTFMPLVEDFVDQLPQLLPDVWDTLEPSKNTFSCQNIRETISSWPGAQWKFSYRRRGQPRYWGGFSRLYWAGSGTTHARIFFYLDISKELESPVIDYFQHAAIRFNAPYGVFNARLTAYESPEQQEESRLANRNDVFVSSLQLQKSLPGIFWAQVFGPPYVRLFGLDKLLSAPAYKVKQLGPEMVYIQLSESLFDLHERYEEVDAVRRQVKAHLDDNIFFRPENPEGHVYRTPDFQFPPKPKAPTSSSNVTRVLNISADPEPVKYDDASWHWGASDFPKELPQEAGATHIGMYVAWALLAGLGDGEYINADVLSRLQQRRSPPGLFLMENFGGKFLSSFLNKKGNAFAKSYFDYQQGNYLLDYMATLLPGNSMPYESEDSWSSFDHLKPLLDTRFEEWRSTSSQDGT